MVIQYILMSKEITMGVVGGSNFIIILSSTTLSFSFTMSSTSFTTHSKFLNTSKSTITTRIFFSSLSLSKIAKTQRQIHNLFIYPCVFALPTRIQKKPQTQNSKTRDVQMSFKLFVFGFATLLLLSNFCFFPFFTHNPNSRPSRRKVSRFTPFPK